MEQPPKPRPPSIVETPVDLLKNIRSILDIVNTRIHWKTEELLPVGQTIKQLNDIILQNKESLTKPLK